MNSNREKRLYKLGKSDQRDPFPRDRDRILYSSAFKRLAGVTQIVSPEEGVIFHNRLTHSLKVAQVARRTAEQLIKTHEKKPQLIEELGINPEVADAAALAHDLGHPPFGHNGEETLDELINEKTKKGISDGFEGNAQTFRVVTKLSKRSEEWNGLNLTRATLNALLKYPWHKQTEGFESKKFGAYHSEDEEFKFAREGCSDNSKSAEAEIMDYADDITYSVHDVEDFYRAGLIPLHRILRGDDNEIDQFLRETSKHWYDSSLTIDVAMKIIKEGLRLFASTELNRPYDGGLAQKAALRSFTSTLVGRYVVGIEVSSGKKIVMNEDCKNEILILKQLPKYYIYDHPNLSAQKYGQKKIIKFLFESLIESFNEGNKNIWPKFYHDLLLEIGVNEKNTIRIAADIIASRTEQEINELFQKLNGIKPGRISDLIQS